MAALAPTAAQAAGGPSPQVSHAVGFDVSPPLKKMHPLPAHRGPGEHQIRRRTNPPFGFGPPLAADPVQQISAPAAPAASTLTNWDGVPNRDGYYPPDTEGDVGLNDYVQWVNGSLEIWSKTGTVRYGPVTGNTLWSGFTGAGGLCASTNQGDPIVIYDRIANRWLLSQFAFGLRGHTPKAPYYQCIAVSQTSDPTGAYYRYAFQINASTGYFPDYPKFGVWPDAYYMSTNNFNGNFFAGAGAYAFQRTKMLTGDPSAAMLSFGLSSTYEGLLPATLNGPTLPPNGAPDYFGAVDTSSASGTGSTFQLWKFHVDFTTAANSTFTGPVNTSVAPYTFSFCGQAYPTQCIQQPGTSQTLDPLADRLMYRLNYRNFGDHESLVVAHTVNVGSDRAGMRWYEIRSPGTTPTIYQQGTFAPADGVSRWMGSANMDGAGDIALGYSASNGTNVYPSVRYTGRLAGDPLGTMTVAEQSIIEGGGSQTGADRWGDYSTMSVDPADDTTFWYTQEYYSANSATGWKTRIGSFKLGVDTTPPDTVIDSGPSGPTNNASPSFTFHSTEPGSTFECKLDGPGATTGSFSSCSSPKNYTSLAEGSYTFSVRATDASSNTDPTPATRSFTLDATPPAAPSITSPASDGYNTTGNVTIGGTAEAGSTVELFDGATSKGTTTATGGGTWSKSLTAVADGTHPYTAKATDAAGNTSTASNTRTITVDTTPPDTVIDSGPSGTTSSRTATFAFHATEGGATFQCKLDGPAPTTGSFAPCSSPTTYTGLANGSYTFSVQATDQAGNTDPSPATQSWTVPDYRGAILATPGLLAYWRLGESSGTTAFDELGAHNGTYGGGVTLGEPGALFGNSNTAVRFDGVNGAVTVPDSASLDPTSITVELWARSDGATWNQLGWLASKRDTFVLHPLAGTRKVQWYIHLPGGTWNSVGYSPPSITVWHQYVGTYNASTGEEALFVDGVQVASQTFAPGNLGPSSNPLTIGSDLASLNRYGKGWIDEVAIYNRALPAQTIADHFMFGTS